MQTVVLVEQPHGTRARLLLVEVVAALLQLALRQHQLVVTVALELHLTVVKVVMERLAQLPVLVMVVVAEVVVRGRMEQAARAVTALALP